MSLWDDYEAEAQFAYDFPHGVPCDEWTTRNGRTIPIKEMTDNHIKNCMRIVGEDDPWYGTFLKELNRRSQENETAKAYRAGLYEALDSISCAHYGKQCYFVQENGTVYSRISCKTLPDVDSAIAEFSKYIAIDQ